MTFSSIFQRASRNTEQSAIRYVAINVTSANYTSTSPFRAVNVAAEGTIVITGLDGVDATVTVVPGTNPLAGLGIKSASAIKTMTLCF